MKGSTTSNAADRTYRVVYEGDAAGLWSPVAPTGLRAGIKRAGGQYYSDVGKDIRFTDYEPLQVMEQILRLRNKDKVARSVKIVPPDSKLFQVHPCKKVAQMKASLGKSGRKGLDEDNEKRVLPPEGEGKRVAIFWGWMSLHQQHNASGRTAAQTASFTRALKNMERWYANGQVLEKSSYSSGKLDGKAVKYYDNGQVFSSGVYAEGKEEGVWTFHHRNGVLESKGLYEKGRQKGTWVSYNDNGSEVRSYKF